MTFENFMDYAKDIEKTNSTVAGEKPLYYMTINAAEVIVIRFINTHPALMHSICSSW